ncbi:MAG: hypothetical protein QOH73_2013 [Gaiellaceae bacterium]|nr:hypothetical protein [Gaiellaceae bacterium]
MYDDGASLYDRRMRRRIVLLTVAVGAAGFGAGSTFGATLTDWAWQVGDGVANIGRVQGSSDMQVNATNDLNIAAHHIRIGGEDGNFEFEHGAGAPASHLNAYIIGTPTRSPISIGGGADGQDVIALLVQGKAGQTNDLQQWQAPEGKTLAAIDGKGRLRLGTVTLTLGLKRGKVVLTAVLPDGTKQVLATGH